MRCLLSALIRNYGDVFYGGSGNAGEGRSIEFCQKGCKILAGEGPLQGNGDLFIAVWKGQQTLFHFWERGEVIGRKDRALHHGEVDFDLIQPTRVQGRVDQDHGRPLGAQSMGGFWAAVSRAVVPDPEDPTGGSVRLLAHHLGHPAVHRSDSILGLAATQQLGSMDIPGRSGRSRLRRGGTRVRLAGGSQGKEAKKGACGDGPGCWFSHRQR